MEFVRPTALLVGYFDFVRPGALGIASPCCLRMSNRRCIIMTCGATKHQACHQLAALPV